MSSHCEARTASIEANQPEICINSENRQKLDTSGGREDLRGCAPGPDKRSPAGRQAAKSADSSPFSAESGCPPHPYLLAFVIVHRDSSVVVYGQLDSRQISAERNYVYTGGMVWYGIWPWQRNNIGSHALHMLSS
ncbi:uncharacterized protein LOC27207864 [Drosophila simulans]|uniref:uncharacterized protein LOC27207864 n=1 Tax=Drosophila simulans TaxID=7240 RepID=UPI00078AE4DD|nr:uncharacterized protein LOC27207864 [Drosophila simulans]KMZ10273.1 uncharacterized protein Dsimw501_GD28015 [Drosophila simulans]